MTIGTARGYGEQQAAPRQLSKEERNRMIEEHLSLVRYLVRRMSVNLPQHIDEEDLVSAGMIGLVNSADRYDPSRGILFKTFAEQRIRGIILDELRANDWLTRSNRDRYRQLERATQALEQRLSRDPEPEEVAAHMGLALEEYYQLVDDVAPFSVVSLDETWMSGDEDSGLRLADMIDDNGVGNPHTSLLTKQSMGLLAAAIGALAERERLIVTLYHHEDMTLKEIAGILGVSEARVSQLHTQAIVKLRAKVRGELDGEKGVAR